MKSRTRIEKVDEVFVKELREIGLRNAHVSGYPPSIRRLTKAIRKHSSWDRIKQDIMNTRLEDDRKKNE